MSGIDPTARVQPLSGPAAKKAEQAAQVIQEDLNQPVRGRSSDPLVPGVRGEHFGAGGLAGQFDGDVSVTGRFQGTTRFDRLSVEGGFDGTTRLGDVVVDGDVHVTGDLILAGADYAEDFEASSPRPTAGTVMVIDDDGLVVPCTKQYDTSVAGVISGARGVRPAIVLDRHDSAVTIALMGKVWCLADAGESPIRPGDLLTTSNITGHAQAVRDRSRATGALVGKALTALHEGRGMVRILVGPR